MGKRIVEKDFGGIVKCSIMNDIIYVDPRFALELRRKKVTPELVNNIEEILCNEPELLSFFIENKDHLMYNNLNNALNEIPIKSIKRIIELVKQVEDEEAAEEEALIH